MSQPVRTDTPPEPGPDTQVDAELVQTLARRREELGDAAPRFALFLTDCHEEGAIRKTIERIPVSLDDWFEEIVVIPDRNVSVPATADALASGRRLAVRFQQPLGEPGHGAARKEAFEYALGRGFDHVVVMRGDTSHPPEKLPELVEAALRDPDRLVLAIRRRPAGTTPRGLAHRATTAFQNHALGMRLEDYPTSYRLYPVAALRRIPFQLDANGTALDAEILLQFRALGVPIHEEPLLDGRRGDGTGSDDLAHGLTACATAMAYRFHQVHLTRDGRFLVDHDVHYTLKRSETSSHMQIVAAIRPDSRVLDLGCSQGLLARPLLEKNVRVTGVDVEPGQRLASELAEYHPADLEAPLDLPVGRIFDYVVCADVIEHLRNRTQLLRSARRYLKPDGRLIISTPNIALWFYRLSLAAGRFEYGPRGVLDETHVHLFTGASFRREVEKAGFRVVRQRVTALPFEVVFESTGRSRLIRRMASTYHMLARLWPSLFAYQYVLEAQITTLEEAATGTLAGEAQAD